LEEESYENQTVSHDFKMAL